MILMLLSGELGAIAWGRNGFLTGAGYLSVAASALLFVGLR
jgi:hypothetical protein